MREEIERKIGEVNETSFMIDNQLTYQFISIDQEFEKLEEVFVTKIKNLLAYFNQTFKQQASANFSNFTKPLSKTKSQLESYLSLISGSQNLGSYILDLRDKEELGEDLLSSLADLEKDIEKVKDYNKDPTLVKFDEAIKSFYTFFPQSSGERGDMYVNMYSTHFNAAYMSIIDTVVYEWSNQVERIFKEIVENSWVYSRFVIDENRVNFKRRQLGSKYINGLEECHEILSEIQGQFLNIEMLRISLDGKLATNPNSIKFLQAMMRAMNLTMVTHDLQLILNNNQINESNFIDVSRVIVIKAQLSKDSHVLLQSHWS